MKVHLNALLLLVQTLLDALHVLRDWVFEQERFRLTAVVLLGVDQELVLEAVLVDLQVLSLCLWVILVESQFDVAVDDL